MSEQFYGYNSHPGLDLEGINRLNDEEYSRGWEPLQDRWSVYDQSEQRGYSRYEYYLKSFDALNLPPDGGLLDVGGNTGEGMMTIRMLRQFNGRGVVVDTKDKILQKGRSMSSALTKVTNGRCTPVEFINCSGEAMDFPDNSFDGILAMFMIYHTDYKLLLPEIKRVAKPDARIVISTSGPMNKLIQRQFEREMASHLGAQPPPIFSSSFDTVMAHKILPKYFKMVEPQPIPPWHSAMRFYERHYIPRWGPGVTDDEQEGIPGEELYLHSLDAMREHFKIYSNDPNSKPRPPTLDEWEAAKEKMVIPVIKRMIEEEGSFVDLIDREFFVMINDK